MSHAVRMKTTTKSTTRLVAVVARVVSLSLALSSSSSSSSRVDGAVSHLLPPVGTASMGDVVVVDVASPPRRRHRGGGGRGRGGDGGNGNKLPSAPSRPSDSVDVDYGGAHPFDAYRYSYDASYRRRLRPLLRIDDRRIAPVDDVVIGGGDVEMEELEVDDDEVEEDDDGAHHRRGRTSSSRRARETYDDGDGGGVGGRVADDDDGWTTTVLTDGDGGVGIGDSSYRPLRLRFDVSDLLSELEVARSGYDELAATRLYLLIHEVLPMTSRTWGDVLRVIPVNGGIYPLAARGGTEDDKLIRTEGEEGEDGGNNDGGGVGGGGGGGSGGTTAYDDPVRLMYCPDETTSGIGGGADLLVYATVNRHCGASSSSVGGGGDGGGFTGTLASALSCQRDQYDRPITGSIDFCLDGMTVPGGNEISGGGSSGGGGIELLDVESLMNARETDGTGVDETSTVGSDTVSYYAGGDWDGGDGDGIDDGAGASGGSSSTSTSTNRDGDGRVLQTTSGGNWEMIQYSVGVAIHEIGHVLGISSDSLQYFRHPITGVPLTKRPFELSTVTCVDGEQRTYVGMPSPEVLREGRHPITGNRYFMVVTPTVRRVVRNHFDCQTMEGARLENQQGTTDCFGSHWDELQYYTEIMGPVFSHSVNVLSPLTLAYLEDSGWYRANYESEYVKISPFGHGAGCDFIEGICIDPDTGDVPHAFSEMFCNDPTSISSSGAINVGASGPQTCDPSHTQKAYCDLVSTNELVAIGNQAIALEQPPASFQYFEGRPELRPLVLTTADFCPIPQLSGQSCLEYGGGYSITNEMQDAGETYGPNSRCIETDGSRTYSLCLETVCNAELGMVQIVVAGQLRNCEYDGQVHEVLYDYDGGGDMRIKCPKAALICPNLFCPSNCSGRGRCVFASSDEGASSSAPTTSTTAPAASPLARCVCDSAVDVTPGCYRTPLALPAEYGVASANPNKANRALFMIIVGSLIAALAVMFVAVRQWKARQNVFM